MLLLLGFEDDVVHHCAEGLEDFPCVQVVSVQNQIKGVEVLA